MIHDIFKIPLYAKVLEEVDNDGLNDFVWRHQKEHYSVVRSNVLGYQSSNLLGGTIEDCIFNLKKAILPHVVKFGNTMDYRTDKMTMLSMWFNINMFKDYNKEHIHPDSLISGVYYSSVPENCGDIEFNHPSPHIIHSNDDTTLKSYDSKYSALTWHYPPGVGQLYLFPSWLSHRVLVNKSQEPRISFSFNCHLDI